MHMTAQPIKTIAIDPGYDRVGWAIGNKKGNSIELLDYGCIITHRGKTLFDRYYDVECELEMIIRNHQPKQAIVEQLFFSKNTTTALKVAEARGVIIGTLLRNNIKVAEIHPAHAKIAVTGKGNATKAEMKKMLELLLKQKLTGLDDALDAVSFLCI